jgi:septal ring factor EnvC (AmiA/AmiB activator)
LPPPNVHVVRSGERFEDVARDYNVDLRSLALLNRMQPPYVVQPGDRIVLPAMARAYESTPSDTPPAANNPAGATPAAQLRGRFTWPLRGDIVARFGAQNGGGQLDGIEIAGREGAPIAAAADGEVVYAGTDLPAYGTIVLIRHADDLVTAYAYARRASVREGDQVRAGQTIAELGSRAGGRTALLFQVRRGSTPVDPAPLLGIGD